MTSGVNYIAIIYRRKLIIAYKFVSMLQKFLKKGVLILKKHKIKIYDENWNLESEHFVEIPTTKLEKKQKQKEKEIKDLLYSSKILRYFALKIIERGDRNAKRS